MMPSTSFEGDDVLCIYQSVIRRGRGNHRSNYFRGYSQRVED